MTKVAAVTESQNEQSTVPNAFQLRGAALDDLWDGFPDHAPCKAQSMLIEEVKADLIKQGLLHS